MQVTHLPDGSEKDSSLQPSKSFLHREQNVCDASHLNVGQLQTNFFFFPILFQISVIVYIFLFDVK